jgi:hypothetical protein
MNMKELTLKKERIALIGRWALALIAAAIISPVVFFAIKGLVGIIISLVLGLTIVNFSPWLSMKFANWKLKAIKSEAARNPVETLQNVYGQKQEQRKQFKQQITNFRTKVSGFSDKVEGFKAQFPQDAQKFAKNMGSSLKKKSNIYICKKVLSTKNLNKGEYVYKRIPF